MPISMKAKENQIAFLYFPVLKLPANTQYQTCNRKVNVKISIEIRKRKKI